MRKLFYIDYPQEQIEGKAHVYRCVYCKKETTAINGKLEGHLDDCDYRKELEASGYETFRTSHTASDASNADVSD